MYFIRINNKTSTLLLKRKEKTQKEVAQMLGISQSYISRLEKKIIADALDNRFLISHFIEQ